LYIASNQQNNSTLPVQNIVTIYRNDDDDSRRFGRSQTVVSNFLSGEQRLSARARAYRFPVPTVFCMPATARAPTAARPRRHELFSRWRKPVTACIWRIDPHAEKPDFEILPKIRNDIRILAER